MRRWLASFVLILGGSACEISHSRPDTVGVKFAALNWLDSAADKVEHLTRQPSTCLRNPDDPAVQRGALLFASPTLLGGQPAKAGLSCASCHRNGRGNPDFVFAGISEAPGTADVTHGLFSKVRADGVFNPVIIPDLARPNGQKIVDRGAVGELETFLSEQIVEEFSGTEPQARVIADLATYLRALDESACDPNALEVQSWRSEFTRIRATIISASKDSSSHKNAVRAALGRVHARLHSEDHANLRADLITFSRALERGDGQHSYVAKLDQLEVALEAVDAQTLYNPDVLTRFLP